MNNQLKIADTLDAFSDKTTNLDKSEVQVMLFDEYIGVDAPDAQEWYGGGVNVLDSVDRAAQFVARIANPAVQDAIGDNDIGFKVLYSTVSVNKQYGKFDYSILPANMISCIVRANIVQNAAVMAEKAKAVVQ